MLELLRYLGRQKYSLLGLSVLMFFLLAITKGNDERIGLGFISLNAIPAFLIIIFGFRLKLEFSKAYIKICAAILIFTLLSFAVNGESIIPLYSIIGNILLSLAMAQSFNSKLSKLFVDSAAVIFSFVFLSYYLGLYWEPFTDEELSDGVSRLSYMSINPNGVSEFIAIAVVSLMFIAFKAKRANAKMAYLILFVLVAMSFVPLLLTASRKGFFLFVISILLFLFMKYRWYTSQKFVVVSVVLILVASFYTAILPAIQISSASTLTKRFQGERFSLEAAHRYDIASRSINKGLESPLFGHGLESSRNEKFLQSIGLWNYKAKTPINSHNGFINIFLKGGFVYLIIHFLLFISPLRQIWRYVKSLREDSDMRDQLILCFIYIIIFIAHIVSSGNGELYKLGWLLLGFAVGQVWNVQAIMQHRLRQWKENDSKAATAHPPQ